MRPRRALGARFDTLHKTSAYLKSLLRSFVPVVSSATDSRGCNLPEHHHENDFTSGWAALEIEDSPDSWATSDV